MRYLHRNEWLGYGVLAGAAVVASLPLFPYQWHVFLHIAGAVVFLGNIIVTGVWMLLAERTRSIPVIHFSAKAVIRADFLFTLPGVLLLVMNGLVMVVARWGGWDAFHQVFLDHHRAGVVHRIRGHMARQSLSRSNIAWRCSQTRRTIRTRRHRSSSSAIHRWYFWGGLAIALPLCSLYLMVHKPAFG